jgi:hypothetical protein
MWIAGLVVLGTAQVTGSVTADGGDYVDIPFTVPANTVEIEISRTYDTTAGQILDFGVWQPEGYRGWSGGLTDDIIVGVDQSTRGYMPGAITPAPWTLVLGKARLDP